MLFGLAMLPGLQAMLAGEVLGRSPHLPAAETTDGLTAVSALRRRDAMRAELLRAGFTTDLISTHAG